ncbi:RNA polymerase sigma factor [Rhodobacter sp. ETT8]|uniref:RNA polymerase sigma factor n=1 Tax=Pseudotabrizicola algicola TaxID=2709381 RepID=A0A6B3RM68_9RHOB|nr:RNA polymerase sigma factor [Pseudotabrizicola algicola]NEX46551.1 RNA polymerase sigma factor [Pseudotabrizicola algicola]
MEACVSNQFQRDLVALVPKLRRFAFSLTCNAADGDDLVQSACEKALRNRDQFQAGSRLDSWMYRIVQTAWLDDMRKRKVRGPSVDPDDIELGDEGRGASLPEDRMMLASVTTAMASLPDPQRVVLSLVAIEGLSYKEAADVLEVPVGTVMSRLSRAREALLPHLGISRGGRQ